MSRTGLVVVASVTAVVLGMVGNVATGWIDVPVAWRPLVWAVVVVLGLVSVVAAVMEHVTR